MMKYMIKVFVVFSFILNKSRLALEAIWVISYSFTSSHAKSLSKVKKLPNFLSDKKNFPLFPITGKKQVSFHDYFIYLFISQSYLLFRWNAVSFLNDKKSLLGKNWIWFIQQGLKSQKKHRVIFFLIVWGSGIIVAKVLFLTYLK